MGKMPKVAAKHGAPMGRQTGGWGFTRANNRNDAAKNLGLSVDDLIVRRGVTDHAH